MKTCKKNDWPVTWMCPECGEELQEGQECPECKQMARGERIIPGCHLLPMNVVLSRLQAGVSSVGGG